MNLKFNYIILHNFLSYEDAEINLQNGGYILVQGENQNAVDVAHSNGSGKSAIFEAISYALTGETIRGTKDIVRANSDEKCYVELCLEVDNVEHIIIRGKDSSKSTLQFFLNGKDISAKGIRDTEILLKQYIGDLNSLLIGSVIVLGQGLPMRFSNNTPSGRKEVLEKLSHSDYMFDDIKERLSKRKENLLSQVNQLHAEQLALKKECDLHSDSLQMLNTKLCSLEPIEVLKDKQEHNQVLLSTLTQNLSVVSEKIALQEKTIESIREQELQLNLTKIKQLQEIDSALNKESDKLLSKQVELSTSIKMLKGKLLEMDNIKEFCPTCGQKIPHVILPNREPVESSISQLSNELCVVHGKLEALKTKQGVDHNTIENRIETQIGELSKSKACAIQEKNNLKVEYSTLSTCIQDAEKIINKCKVEIENRLSLESDLKNEIGAVTIKLNEAQNKKENTLSKISNLEERLSIIGKFITATNRDFRGVLLYSVIELLNSFAKEYSSVLFDDYMIVHLCLDKNNLNILLGNKEYESLSTGERLKCDIIIQLALRKMLCKYLDFSCNIIVLDELFDGLDTIGCERVINLLFSTLTDIDTTFIITHRADLPITSDSVLRVIKDSNGVSRVE